VEVLKACDNIVAGVVIGMPKDEDIGMKRPEGFLGMLLLSVLVYTRSEARLTSEFTVAVSLSSPSTDRDLTLTSQSLRDLLVHNHIDFDAALGRSLEHMVQPITVIAGRWAPQV